MSRMKWKRRSLASGVILGFAPSSGGFAQDLPDPLPPLPPVAASPVLIASPVVVAEPPLGPALLDLDALARHAPKNVEKKRESLHWRRKQARMLGYPEDFVPRPLGASVYDHGRAMVSNGDAARLVLFHYDFVVGSDRLNPRGFGQLMKHAAKIAEGPHPLIIEPTPDQPGLAERRRLAVLNLVASWPFPIAPDRIIVAAPRSNGLPGIDAQIINGNGMERTREYGPPIPINSNGVNSFSGVTGQ